MKTSFFFFCNFYNPSCSQKAYISQCNLKLKQESVPFCENWWIPGLYRWPTLNTFTQKLPQLWPKLSKAHWRLASAPGILLLNLLPTWTIKRLYKVTPWLVLAFHPVWEYDCLDGHKCSLWRKKRQFVVEFEDAALKVYRNLSTLPKMLLLPFLR